MKDGRITLDNIINLKLKKSDKQKPKPLKKYYSLLDTNDKTLLFESRFESGNLHSAYKINDNYYQLILQNDTNTAGYSQWFYFRVQNIKKGEKIKFDILNFVKEKLLSLNPTRFLTKE